MFGVFFKETITDAQTKMFNKPEVQHAGPNPNPRLTKYELNDYTMPSTLTGADYQFLVNTSGKKSKSVTRIRRIWQFPNPRSSYDETDGGLLPATIFWWQVLYSWSDPGPSSTPAYVPPAALGSYNQDWFLGDVVPFPACAYIVRMVTQGTGASFTRYYSVEQMLYSVQYDVASQWRHTMVYSNHVSTAVKTGATSTATAPNVDDDLPFNNEEISYYPGWCAFYWLTRGKLILKVDIDCQSSWATDPAHDPCGSSTYLFPNPTSMKHFGYTAGSDQSDTATFIDQVFIYGFMYFAIAGTTPAVQVWKAQRTSTVNGNIQIIQQWNLSTLSTLKSLSPPMTPIFRMNSLDGYGYYITMSNTYNAATIWQYVIYLKLNADGTKAVDIATGNYIEMNDNTFANLQQPQLLNPLRIDAGVGSWNQKLLQTKGDMVDSRPLYEAWGGGTGQDYTTNRNKVNLITSVTNLYMSVSQTANNGAARSMDFYNYDVVVNPNQMFVLMPGTPTDDIGNPAAINWDQNKVAIMDVIQKDEVMRWPMHYCGDGVLNVTAFEVCDYAAVVMDPAGTGYSYPDTTLYPFYKATTSAGLPSRGVWYWPSTVALGFPTTAGYPKRFGDNNYHICNTNCQDLPINVCGDGVQSNGPTNSDGREACDDGNQVSGDGCSADCKTIEVGWECPVWGAPCNLLCGNGVLDPPYYRYLSDGVTKALFTEQCDLGDPTKNAITEAFWSPVWGTNNGRNFNFGTWAKNEDAFDEATAYQHACSSTCSISSRYYWACNTNTAVAAVPGVSAAVRPTSQCAYLCGNKWLDNIGQVDSSHATSHTLTEECDLLVQQYSGETRSGYTYDANLANVNLQTSPVPGTTTPQAWLAPVGGSVTFTTGTNGNWIWPFITPNVETNRNYAIYDQRNIGCTELCKKRTPNFICPPSNLYDVGAQTIQQTNRGQAGSKPAINWTGPQLLCSDRIQDGVYDGPYSQILRTLQTPSIKTDSWQWNSYILYSTYNDKTTTMVSGNSWETSDTNDRIWAEQCDNNGDVTHGCDMYGRIVPGWTCRHYYVAIRETPMLAEIEIPWFRSLCKITGSNLPAWRRLFGDDHSGFTSEGFISHEDALRHYNDQEDDDEWGDDEYVMGDDHPIQSRGLNHNPNSAFKAVLPTTTYPFRNHALPQNAKGGLIGQIRLAEDTVSADAQAIIFAYPLDSTSTPDNVFTYYKTAACTPQVSPYPGVPTSACTILRAESAQTAGTLAGRQRNTFGPYIVGNSGLQTLKWAGFQSGAFNTNIYTSAPVANIEFLGNYEQYYWGYLGLMFVRLSDGATFQIFRMNANFDTQAAAGNAVPESATTIQQTDMKLQFIIPAKVIVAPVFVNDVAVFYYKNGAGQGYLAFAKWSTYVDGLVLMSTVQVTGDTSTSPEYQKYSLVRVATGVIFKVAGATSATFYKTSDYSWAATTVTVSSGTATVGTVSAANQVFLQPRDNPKTFVATTIPQIFMAQNNNYFSLMTWDEGTSTLTVTTSIQLPCSNGLTPNTGGYPCYDQMLTLSPEWIDVGYKSVVILSPINCAAKKGLTPITGMSARFYLLSTVPDIDANNDGIVDGTQTYTLGVLDAGSGTRVNYFKGWTCWDLPNYNEGTATSVTTFATTATWTYPYTGP